MRLIGGGPSGAGKSGKAGRTLRNGAGAPADGLGVNGDFYIDTTSWKIHGPKAGGTWPAGVALIGPAGAPGADGDILYG
jgi:hypothetical protein